MALPGVTTILKDRFYALTQANAPTGPRVCAIATRNTPSGTAGVQDLDPYSATNEQSVIAAYGAGSGCHRAFLELLAGGSATIALVALPAGTTDAALLSTAPGNPVDAAFAAAEQSQPDILVPWGRGGHPSEWEAWLIPGNPMYGATPSYVEEAAATPLSPGSVPFGFYADTPGMVLRVAQACSGITARSNPCFGVLGVKPFVGVGANAYENIIASDLNTYLKFPNVPLTSDATLSNYGPYVSVVATEVRPVSYPLEYGYSNGAGMYAAQVSNLASWSAPTGKHVSNVSALRWAPTRTQQDVNISQRSMVPLGLNFNRIPFWVDAPTFAASGSDYSRLTTLRVIFDAVQLVRQIAQTFVGESASMEHRNSFETAISSGLRGMVILGALITADFQVTYQPSLNQASVDLVLTPPFEIRNIVISVSVNL